VSVRDEIPIAAVRRTRPARLGGSDGNERLTGVAAVVLLVLLALEGVTIVFLGPLLPLHLFVGLLLIPPVALKLASTGYRFARYYAGSPAYRRKGPPAALLRLLAPAVVASTVAVFASGVWLLLAGPRVRGTALPLHKASFILWFAVTTVHVLGHLPRLPRVLRSEYARPDALRPGDRGRAARQLAIGAALVAGLALALALVPDFARWQHAALGDG
jgi:hypothetical protein